MNHIEHKPCMRRLTALILAMLMALTLIPCAAEGQSATVNTRSRVYRSPSFSSDYVALSKGTKVTLLAESGGWAKIERGGVIGYTYIGHLTLNKTSTDYSAYEKNAKDAYVTRSTRVYRSASKSSSSVRISGGTELRLLNVSGDWALVEKGGVYAYIDADYVALVAEKADEPDYSGLLKSAQPARINADTRVYESASTLADSVRVKEGTSVSLLSTSGNWALIEKSGVYAYVKANCVTLEKETETEPDYSALLKNAKSALISEKTGVYKKVGASEASATLQRGAAVQLLQVSDGWALIEHGGAYGFVEASKVVEGKTAGAVSIPENYLTGAYTNEQKCFYYMVDRMGLNAAAACGILANIRRESNFNPDLGDNYYGLCQWNSGLARTMRAYCEENGLDSASIEGQLSYLLYDMQTRAPKVLNYLKAVDNNSLGAYDAGYYFCYYYERPAKKETSSVTRGELARDTYFEKYA